MTYEEKKNKKNQVLLKKSQFEFLLRTSLLNPMFLMTASLMILMMTPPCEPDQKLPDVSLFDSRVVVRLLVICCQINLQFSFNWLFTCLKSGYSSIPSHIQHL